MEHAVSHLTGSISIAQSFVGVRRSRVRMGATLWRPVSSRLNEGDVSASLGKEDCGIVNAQVAARDFVSILFAFSMK